MTSTGVGMGKGAPARNAVGSNVPLVPPNSGGGRSQGGAARQRSSNWNHNEVIALITCKHKEHADQKQLVDPRSRMVSAAQKWQKISTELQALTHSRTARLAKCCKDKWNALNGDYRKISDYHKGTGHNTSFWDMSNEEKDKYQLPRQFSSDFFEAIEAFQGERNINTPRHLRDSQAQGDSVYLDSNHRAVAGTVLAAGSVPARGPIPIAHPLPPAGLDVVEDNQGNNCVDLDESHSHGLFNSQSVVNLADTPASVATIPQPAAIPLSEETTIPGNTLVKRKRSSVFLPIMTATDKSNKVLVDAMDRLNATQQDLEKIRTRRHNKSARNQLEYMKLRDKKAHKISKQVVTVLSNLSTAMCHAFITDPALIPPPITMSQSSEEQPPSLHVIDTSDDD